MKPIRPRPMDLDAAESVAIAGLQYLAEEPSRLGRFLALTGVGPAELRAQAGAPHMLAAVLEYLLGNESDLLSFTANSGVTPESVTPAWDRLVLEAARLSREPGAPA